VIYFSDYNEIGFREILGGGTNNNVEWKSLALILRLALERIITHIVILGDLNLVINWIFGSFDMHNLVLRLLFGKAKIMMNNLTLSALTHIYGS